MTQNATREIFLTNFSKLNNDFNDQMNDKLGEINSILKNVNEQKENLMKENLGLENKIKSQANFISKRKSWIM